MASNSETGHAINIANFKLLIDKCTGFGASYAPSNTDIKVATMTTQWGTANTANNTLTAAMATAKGLINQREEDIAPLNKLVTKVVNNFDSTNASKKAKKDARGFADKIRGFGVKVVKLPDGKPDPAHVSTSHQSMVQKVDMFNQLIQFLAGDSNYAPNETGIKILTLKSLYVTLKGENDGIGGVIAPVEGARVTRNHALYDAETGMVDVALKAKNYVKSVFGVRSEEARTVTGIKFTRPKKVS